MSIEAMKQALEALRKAMQGNLVFDEAMEIFKKIEQAIAEAEKQEPVAWQVHPFDYGIGHEGVYARTDRLEQVEAWKRKGWNVQPLYTHPQPKREPLTGEEIAEFFGVKAVDESFVEFVRAIEAAHGIKE